MQQFSRCIAVSVLSWLVAGCASYQEKPLVGGDELSSLRGCDLAMVEVRRGADQVRPATAPTFDPTDGLDEDEVVAVALTLNPALKARLAEVGESQATLITAGMWPNPQLGVAARPGIDGASGYSVDADLLFQLLWPGERDARKQAAAAKVNEAKASTAGIELTLVTSVRQQRLEVLAADKVVSLLTEGVELRQHTVELVQKQRQLGEATALDISAAELEFAEIRRDLRQAQSNVQTQTQQLNRLLGLPPEYPLNLAGRTAPLTIVLTNEMADEELDRRLLAGRPELRAKEAEYQRAEQELRLAVIQQYPRVSVGPSFQRELDGGKGLGVGANLTLPLLNQNQGEIAEKAATRERIRQEYTALLHQLRANAFAARTAVRNARAEVEIQEREVLPLLQRNTDLFEGAFRAREVSILNWIVAQQRSVNARREYLDSLVKYRRAAIALEAAAGFPGRTSATRPTTQPKSVDLKEENSHE